MRPQNFYYQTSYKKILKNNTKKAHSEAEFSRLLTAAVINKQFCKLLLTNPSMALTNGFCGEQFNLTKEQEKRIMSINAASLEDFARQLIQDPSPSRTSVSFCAGD
jgi:hypothetical protein